MPTDPMTPGERAEFDQGVAALRDVVDALIASAADAYAIDPRPDSETARAWYDQWIRPLKDQRPTELVLIILEMLKRLSGAELANRRLAAALGPLLRGDS